MTCAPSHHIPERETRGRPKANIDWKYVEELLEAGCSGAEIAGSLHINPQTIYDRCVTDHNMLFVDYSAQFYLKGDSLLKVQQYKKALGLTEAGDNTQLIWLGKTRLKQIDPSQGNSNNAQKITVEVKGNGLASGIEVSTSTLSNTDNQGTK